MHEHFCVKGSWCDVYDVFFCVPNTPDIVVVGGGQGEVLILEVGCSLDGYMEKALAENLLKYQPLMAGWNSLGWRCRQAGTASGGGAGRLEQPRVEVQAGWNSLGWRCRQAGTASGGGAGRLEQPRVEVKAGELYQDSRYEIFIDQSLISQGRLLTDEVQYTESPDSQPEPPLSGLGVGSVAALGLELWSLSGEVMFDNFLLTDDLKLAERWTQDTWGQKQPGLLERLLIATNSRPWLWGVYIFTVGLPITLFISYMWPDKRFGPPDQDYYYKKSDEPQPDRQPERDQPDRPTSLSDYGAVSREGARRRETQKVQRKSDLEVENE
ncbi:uncharacterized protein si:ch211-274f20.2 isoform X2 [Oncorhynchus keta]|uniref:uncharacterized protein si:ch211-274f20.2 isoform X2 n=1 Tax=Oncorhynchus keta TaxID=8018 RepID=UPI00227A1819|nr:uncharacterized protein si:ch211-274f20.2 isoform X2 [Oncorhynchus keta]